MSSIGRITGVLALAGALGLASGVNETARAVVQREHRGSEEAVVFIGGPTLIAFFPPAAEDESAEVLADFYQHLGGVRSALDGSGVAVHDVPASSVLVQYAGVRWRCASAVAGVGFGICLIAPRREPEIYPGVTTDVDLMREAIRYFGLRGSPPRIPGGGIPYVIEGKALHVFGHALEPTRSLDLSDPATEESIHVGIATSPSGRWSVITFLNPSEEFPWSYDFWLYDAETRAIPIALEVNTGRNAGIVWHGDAVFEVAWGGMGYTSSVLLLAEDPARRARVDDMLLYDQERALYVSFFQDGVEVGRVFTPEVDQERFLLPLEYVSAVDARMTIDSVEIQGPALSVAHRKADGSLARVQFFPELLSERGTSTKEAHPR